MNRAEIAMRIPHAGPMCLLDELVHWDAHRVRCRSMLDRKSPHPLALRGVLVAPHLIEYAAQAAALHSHLLLEGRDCSGRSGGVIAAVKGVKFEGFLLSLEVNELDIHATCEVANASGLIYRFEVLHNQNSLCDGQFTIARASATAD